MGSLPPSGSSMGSLQKQLVDALRPEIQRHEVVLKAQREVEVLHLQPLSGEIGRRALGFGNEMREVVADDSGSPSRVVRYNMLPEERMRYRQDAYGVPDPFPWEEVLANQTPGTGIMFARLAICAGVGAQM